MSELAVTHSLLMRCRLNSSGVPQACSNVNPNHGTAPKWHRPLPTGRYRASWGKAGFSNSALIRNRVGRKSFLSLYFLHFLGCSFAFPHTFVAQGRTGSKNSGDLACPTVSQRRDARGITGGGYRVLAPQANGCPGSGSGYVTLCKT